MKRYTNSALCRLEVDFTHSIQASTQFCFNLNFVLFFLRPYLRKIAIIHVSSSSGSLDIRLQSLFPNWGRVSHHCFFPFFFLLLPLPLPPPPPLFAPLFSGFEDGLSLWGPPFMLSKTPACIAFWNHSKNSSSVMQSSTLGIRPPFCPGFVPFPELYLEEAILVFTWKLGLWVFAGHLIPCQEHIKQKVICTTSLHSAFDSWPIQTRKDSYESILIANLIVSARALIRSSLYAKHIINSWMSKLIGHVQHPNAEGIY